MARRKKKKALLHIVVRAVVTRPMPAEVVRLLLDRAIRQGSPRVSGLEIVGLDWAKGRSASSSDVTGDVRGAMRDLQGPLLGGSRVRFAVVRGEPDAAPVKPVTKIKRQATGHGGYTYRDARGRFATREAWESQRGQFGPDEERILDTMRAGLRDQILNEDVEVEMSVEYEEAK